MPNWPRPTPRPHLYILPYRKKLRGYQAKTKVSPKSMTKSEDLMVLDDTFGIKKLLLIFISNFKGVEF